MDPSSLSHAELVAETESLRRHVMVLRVQLEHQQQLVRLIVSKLHGTLVELTTVAACATPAAQPLPQQLPQPLPPMSLTTEALEAHDELYLR